MLSILTFHRRAGILPASKFLLLRRPYIRYPPPPKPPSPPKKPQSFTFHDQEWEDPYSWMTSLSDKVAMRHMNIYLEQEEKYTHAVMSDTEQFQSKLQSEMASRLAFELSSYPIRWGPWLYYRRVEEGKPFQVLCRRLASLNEEFISHKSPSAGFDYTSGQKIEQKLIDYNKEAERFGGLAHEGLSEVSPDHRFIAYTMYGIDKGLTRLSVRNLNSGGALCDKPEVDRVTTLAWAKDGRDLLYVVTDPKMNRPYRIYCSTMGSTNEDILVHEELDDDADLVIRNTKDFRFVTVNRLSPNSCKMYVINAADPLSGLSLVWECNQTRALCIIEHHLGFFYLFTNAAKAGQPVDSRYLLRSPVGASNTLRVWEDVFTNEPDLIIEDVHFFNSHLVLSLKEDGLYKLGSIPLPLPAEKGPFSLKELDMYYLPLPKYVCHFSPGRNNDFYSSTVRFTISSPVMPDAVVDYDLSSGKWDIVQQQNVFHERAKILYGRSSLESIAQEKPNEHNLWNDLSEFYACERHDVSSGEGVRVPLTVVYCRKKKKEDHKPCLLHGYGAYGQPLDKRWRSELKSLLDRGWTVAFADVRGGGGGGKTWHYDGQGSKKSNSVKDYISCAEYLVETEIVNEKQLAGAGFGAGGLVVASAINCRPDLFRAVVLKFPFLDATNNLLYPIISPTPVDYEEFGNPHKIDDFYTIRKYSPYDNIQKDALYPAVLVSTSLQLNTRFGFWECAKWVARVRELTAYDSSRPVLLNLTMMPIAGDNRYLQCREAALESAFLIKIMRLP